MFLFSVGVPLNVSTLLSFTDSPFSRKMESAMQSSLVDTNSSQNSSGEHWVTSACTLVCLFVNRLCLHFENDFQFRSEASASLVNVNLQREDVSPVSVWLLMSVLKILIKAA